MTIPEKWRAAVIKMKSQLNADARNHRQLADPWSRTVLSMVGAWRIRASSIRKPSRKRSKRVPRDWGEAIKFMKTSLQRRAKQQKTYKSWQAWSKRCANHSKRNYEYRRNKINARANSSKI